MPNLTSDEHRDQLIHFNRKQKEKGIKQKSEAFKMAMKYDIYLNSLRATFGYAVTCQKSQGGEWKHVFLDINIQTQKQPIVSFFKWCYTGITRCQQTLYLPEGPFISNYIDGM